MAVVDLAIGRVDRGWSGCALPTAQSSRASQWQPDGPSILVGEKAADHIPWAVSCRV